jgi:blue copper oxidase
MKPYDPAYKNPQAISFCKPLIFFIVSAAPVCTNLFSQGFGQKLFIPDTLSTYNNDTIRLEIEQTKKIFFPGVTGSVIPGFPAFAGDTLGVNTFSYTNPSISNPGILGPTLIWWVGDSVTMAVKNKLVDTTTTHWHGAHVAPHNDGGPHQVIPPNTTWYPSFKIRDSACTMWYHPHLHMMTQMQVNMGMAGMIVIKSAWDPFAKQLPHTYGVDEFPIILQDKFFKQCTGANPQDSISTTCSMGTTFLVNGTWNPYLDVPAQPDRFRILNGSSERSYCLFLRDSTAHEWMPFHVIASDAGYLDKPYKMGTPPVNPGTLDSLLMIMPGERYEIVFDATLRQGHALYLMNMRNYMTGNPQMLSFAGGPNLNDPGCYASLISAGGMLPAPGFDSTALALLKINVGAPNLKPGTLPAAFTPYDIPDAAKAAVTREKHLYLYNSDPNAPPFSIDNINFAMNTINDTVYLDDIEVWNVTNVSTVAHPFHIHDIYFFIRKINGLASNVPPYMKGPKDVAPVTDGSVLSLVTRFQDFATPAEPGNCYMYHCHILDHEDGGMMHQFVVTPHGPSGIHDPEYSAGWNVFPNPAQDNLWIEAENKNSGTLAIFDGMGVLVKQWSIGKMTSKFQLDISDLASGLYLLKLESPESMLIKRISVVH